MPTKFDDSQHPIVQLHAFGDSLDADIEERLDFFGRQLDRAEPFVVLFETTGSAPLTAKQRKMWADWLKQNDHRIRKTCLGCAMVVRGAMVRQVVTAVLWFWTPAMPIEMVATVSEGEDWVRARLREASV